LISLQRTLALAAEHGPEEHLSPVGRVGLIRASLFAKPQGTDLVVSRRLSDLHCRAEKIAGLAISWEFRL
jgi:hypothetical protein